MSFFGQEAFKDFVQQCKQHTELGSGNWEFYVKTTDFTVYRQKAPSDRNPNLYRYRSIGGWSNVKPDTLAHVYLDLEFRKRWDKNMQSHHRFIVNSEGDSKVGHSGNHFEMKYPWPLSNRDYAYTIERKLVKDTEDGGEYQVILGESLPKSSFPEREGVIRIDNYMQNICISPSEDGEGCFVFMDYFDDPKGSIPSSVINWAAKTGVPNFIKSLKNACLQYQQENPAGVSLDNCDIIQL